MFSIATVASSTRMPTASARPPSVMMLIVSPSAPSAMTDARIDSGIETAMITVLRQSPRKSRIIDRRQARGDQRLAQHALMAARTNSDWSNSCGDRAAPGGSDACARSMTSLDARHDVERGGGAGLVDAHQRAALAVGAHDVGLRREAVADVRDVAHVDRRAVDVLIGRSLSSAIVCGLPFISTAYSSEPIFAVPDGRIRFCALDRGRRCPRATDPWPAARLGSRSTEISRCLPPYGNGTAAPCTVASCVRMKLLPEVEQLLLGQRVARQAELQDRHGGGGVDARPAAASMPGGIVRINVCDDRRRSARAPSGCWRSAGRRP